MKRIASASIVALLALSAAPRLAAADGANVARFLVNNSLQVRAPTPFEKAFGKLQAAARARSARRLVKPVVLLKTRTRHTIHGVTNGLEKTRMTGQRQLLFDGKRAYLRLTTTSAGLRNSPITRTVRVPLGRLFGWYGKRLVQASFPTMTEQQVARGLGQLQGKQQAPRLRDRVSGYMQRSYAAFGRTARP
jgi:hypothetical protein